MTNFEFYKNEIKEQYEDYKKFSNNDTFTQDLADVLFDIWKKHRTTRGDLLDWLCEEHQILDKEEKEYLGAVIKPFKNKEEVVITIIKVDMCGVENLEINIKREFDFKTTLYFPSFEKGTMYKGMKTNKSYTLKELGLWTI